MNFVSKSILLSVVTASVSIFGIASFETQAKAMTLNIGDSSLGIDGNVTIFREADNLYDFTFSNTKIGDASDSPPFLIGDVINIQNLSNISTGSSFGPIDNFITDIELTDGEILSFNLEALTLSLFNTGLGGRNTNYALDLTGTFIRASGDVFGFGSLTTQIAGGLNIGQTATRELSGDILAVPTPALLPAALGMGAAALRKKRKQEEADADLTPEPVEA